MKVILNCDKKTEYFHLTSNSNYVTMLKLFNQRKLLITRICLLLLFI